MLRRLQRRPGAVAVLVALCLVAMLAIVALAIDGGLILDQRRRLQSAADAAALAAAIDLYLNNPTSTAKATALSIAASNGYNNDGKTNTVTVNIPPQSANVPAVYKGSGFVEVLITYTPQSYFSGIFNLIPPGITATPPPTQAVARGKLASFGGAILLLDPKGSGALSAAGNAGITVANGPIIVDSNSSTRSHARRQRGRDRPHRRPWRKPRIFPGRQRRVRQRNYRVKRPVANLGSTRFHRRAESQLVDVAKQ